MKRTIISLVSVVMLIFMTLPAGTPVVMGQGEEENNQATTNETIELPLVNDPPVVMEEGEEENNQATTNETIELPPVDDPPMVMEEGEEENNQATTNETTELPPVDDPPMVMEEGEEENNQATTNETIELPPVDDPVDDSGCPCNGAGKNETVTLNSAPTANVELDGGISLTASNSTWPRCISGCNSNDVEVHSDSVWLDIPAGNYTIGQTVTGTVMMNLYFHRTNTYCIVVVADLHEGGVETQANWVSTIIGSHDSHIEGDNTTYSMGTVNWTYGKLFEMQNILVMWSQNSPAGGTCTADCSEYGSPSKCFQVANIIVATPLVADFGFTNVCFCHNTIFADNTTGGVTPYTYDWNFGDGTAHNSTANPTHHYASNGTYTVTLNVTDSKTPTHNVNSRSHNVTVYANPTADAGADTAFCAGGNVQLTGSATGGTPPYTYDWTGPENHPNTQNATISTPGNYTLTVTDDNGCTDSDNVTVTVNPLPTAAFNATPTSGCAPLTVQFTDLSTGSPTSWNWDFGDGSHNTTQNPSHQYASAGTYNVSLNVSNTCGWDDETKTNYITVGEAPTAAFNATPTSGCAPLTVQFTDLSTGSPTSWNWDFGDGSHNTTQNPSHQYASAGTYNVSLNVSNTCGWDDETKTNYITVGEAPTAAFNATPTSGCAPLTVQFTDLSTGSPTSWNWDFGDGSHNTTQNPSHQYASAGTYNVSLNVSNTCGWDDETKTNYITVGEAPTAAFNATPTSGCAPLTVQFTDLSTGSPTSWNWDFGDGSHNTTQNPSHQYAEAGTYNVSLTISNGCGNDTETKENYIEVLPLPVAAFNATPTSGCAPLTVNFTDQSTGTYDTWYWDFGDGGTSIAQNPSHTYTSPGTYTVSLTVSNGCGNDTETKTGYITAEDCAPPPPPPVVIAAGGGGCPTTKYLTVDWEGNNTTKPLYSNDKLAEDLLGPSPDLSDNLFLERGTHAPVVGGKTYYLIVVRELEEIPAPPENYTAIMAVNVTPADAEFDRDIFLTLGLDQSQLPENALNITMDYYDDVNEVWVPLEYEAGGPNAVAELTLTAPINHFSIYGVLVTLAPPPPPAHFVPSGLSIMTSVEKTIFVTKTGKNVTIAATITNDGGQEGDYPVVLKLNGKTVETQTVTLGIGQSQRVSFSQSGLDYGQYDVEVAGLSDTFTASRTINWWLIIGIIVAIGLIIWGVVWGRRRRRRAHQAA